MDTSMRLHGAALAALMLMAGCRTDLPIDEHPADIRGRVTGIIPASAELKSRKILGFLQVEGTREPDTQYDRAAVTVTDSTRVVMWSGGISTQSTYEAIRKEDSVTALFTGPVRESYPVQATAEWITIYR